MLGIVRPTDRHGLRCGPRRDQSRLDPPYGRASTIASARDARHGEEIVQKKTLRFFRDCARKNGPCGAVESKPNHRQQIVDVCPVRA